MMSERRRPNLYRKLEFMPKFSLKKSDSIRIYSSYFEIYNHLVLGQNPDTLGTLKIAGNG